MNVERSRRAREVYARVPSLPPSGPIDVPELASGGEALEFEIGFGRGRFLLDRAAARPRARIVGVETRRKWVHRARERAAAREIENAIALHGDAREAVARMRPDATLERVFVHFPDPWWKARHEKRIVVGDAVVAELARLLACGGELFVQTDVGFRADAYREVLERCPALDPAAPGGEIDANPFGARSSREIRCEALGLPIRRLLFYRRPR